MSVKSKQSRRMQNVFISDKCKKSSTSHPGLSFLSRGKRLQMLLQGDIVPEETGSDAGEAEHLLS